MVLAGSVLMASTSPAFEYSNNDVVNISSLTEDKHVVQDIVFDEDCSSCKYVTIFNSDDELVYDVLVRDVQNIKDKNLLKILEKSDFIMSNQITNYYILSK